MTDFASLAIKVDASEVGRGVGELDKLTTAGTRAEGAVDKLGDSAAQTGAQMRGAGVAASEYASAAQRSASSAMKVGESGKFASHHVQNLAFQVNDLVVGLASGQRPMTVFMQQGAQIGQIMAQAGVGAGGLVKQIGGMVGGFARAHPVIAGITAVVGAAAGALKIFTSQIDRSGELQKYADGLGLTAKEMEKLGPISITAGDTIKGLWKTISDGLGLDKVFSSIASFAVNAFKVMLDYGQRGAAGIYAAFVGTYRGISAIWSNLPSILGEAVIGGANLAITALEKLVNFAIDGLNKMLAAAKPLMDAAKMVGINLQIGHVAFGRVNNPFAGSAASAGGAFKSAYSGAYSEAMGGMKSFGATLSENILGAAKERLSGAAEELMAKRSGKGKNSKAGKAGKEIAFDFKDAANDVLASMVWVNEQAKAAFTWANDNDWDGALKDAKTQTEEVMDATRKAAEETARWREEALGLADALKQVGGFAGGLGTAIQILDAAKNNDYKNVTGPIGYVLGKVASTPVKNKDGTFETLGDRIERIFDKGGKFTKALGETLGAAGQGAMMGAALFGNENKGAQIGGAIGASIGMAVAGPIGSVVGSVLGSVVGGLFKKTTYGAASISNGTVTTSGNRSDLKSGAGQAGGGIAGAVDQIAERLGGTVGNYSVSIGLTNGNWNVNPGAVNGKIGTKWQKDTIDFKKDQEGAIRWAIANAIQDGAIQGVREGVNTLLKAGTDIDAQLTKALKFQGVFDDLKQKTDPLAYSLEMVGREATSLNKIFAEAGATAEEYAQLEQLLAIKRQEAAEQARKDVIDKIREPYDLYTQMLELLGKSEEALAAQRMIELATLKDSLQPLQAWIYQMQDARKTIETFQPLAEDLIAYRAELLGGDKEQSLGYLAAQFRATAIAAGNGDATGLGNLRGAASSFLDAAKENASSALDVQRAQAEVLRAVDKGIFAAETQVDYAQAQLDAINNSAQIMDRLRAEMAAFQAQITENTGLTARILQRFDGNTGLLITTTQDEPLQVQVVT